MVIELRSVNRVFDSEPPVHALRDLDLTVRRGEHLSIVGPSGSGKSTLLNTLGLLDRPTSGRYWLDGVLTNALGDLERTALRGSRIGFVFQSFHLLPYRTVDENVMLAETYRAPRPGRRRGTRADRAREALARVGLGHRFGFLPTRLSGGERQRVAIARALMGEPALLLCDEPTGNLDSENTESVLALFDQLQAQGMTLLVITHDDTVSGRASRRVRINDGRLSQESA
ncbi:ABC transporter ATP-binding protein [Streptomyces sp. NPDC093970]|uniref:ABC transporter ATP-binding protein n=1 Tax=Streptomyces sp. NPDC093970 TaxID=3155076 RepID=UPI0034191049